MYNTSMIRQGELTFICFHLHDKLEAAGCDRTMPDRDLQITYLSLKGPFLHPVQSIRGRLHPGWSCLLKDGFIIVWLHVRQVWAHWVTFSALTVNSVLSELLQILGSWYEYKSVVNSIMSLHWKSQSTFDTFCTLPWWHSSLQKAL